MRSDRIAEFALARQDMPQSALNMAATLLMDTMGVAAKAADLDSGRIASDYAFALHGAGTPEHAACMMFDGRRASIPGAAFAETTSQTQYFMHFALAMLLVNGRIGPEDISGAALSDPKMADVLSRVAVREDARHSSCFPAARWSDVDVTLKDDPTCLGRRARAWRLRDAERDERGRGEIPHHGRKAFAGARHDAVGNARADNATGDQIQ